LEKNINFTGLEWLETHLTYYPPWLEKNVYFTGLKWLETHLNLSMVGENVEFYSPQMARKVFKLSTMLEKILNFTRLKMARNTLELCTMVGENFQFYSSQMARNNLNYPPWLEKFLNFTGLEWLEIHLNYPPLFNFCFPLPEISSFSRFSMTCSNPASA